MRKMAVAGNRWDRGAFSGYAMNGDLEFYGGARRRSGFVLATSSSPLRFSPFSAAVT